MKRATIIKIGLALLGSALLGSLITACGSLVGTNPGPPSGVERLLYDTKTNYVPIVQVVTNQQVVTQFVTNTVPVTNAQNVVEFHTNVVTQTVTNQVVATNTTQQAQYTETLKPGVGTAVQAGGGVLNTFFPGVGAMVVQGILAALAGWGYLRSSKLGDTSAALMQEIESIRTFIRALPNGAAYDTAFVNFLQAHQAEAGVVQQVASMLEKVISNNDAQAAASQMAQFLQQLQLQTPVVPVPGAPPPTNTIVIPGAKA